MRSFLAFLIHHQWGMDPDNSVDGKVALDQVVCEHMEDHEGLDVPFFRNRQSSIIYHDLFQVFLGYFWWFLLFSLPRRRLIRLTDYSTGSCNVSCSVMVLGHFESNLLPTPQSLPDPTRPFGSQCEKGPRAEIERSTAKWSWHGFLEDVGYVGLFGHYH